MQGFFVRKPYSSIIVDQHRSSSAVATSSPNVQYWPESILKTDGTVAEGGAGKFRTVQPPIPENNGAQN